MFHSFWDIDVTFKQPIDVGLFQFLTTTLKILSNPGVLKHRRLPLFALQIVFAAVTLVGYIWHFWPYFMQWAMGQSKETRPHKKHEGLNGQKPTDAEGSKQIDWDSGLKLCCNFSAQVSITELIKFLVTSLTPIVKPFLYL